MPGRRHEAMVDALVERHNLQRTGMMRAVEAKMHPTPSDREYFRDECRAHYRVVPDAFSLYVDGNGDLVLEVFEVARTNEVTNDKLRVYGVLADLDCMPVMSVHIYDTYGNEIECYRQVDLERLAFMTDAEIKQYRRKTWR